MTIYNLGSINIDTVYRVPHLPAPGETLAALSSDSGLGGKGANQSVAACHAGSVVRHIGQIGHDGDYVLAQLRDFGVDVHRVGRVDGPTGTAMIFVDPAAENSIVISPAANVRQSRSAIEAGVPDAAAGDTLMLQNETNQQVFAARLAASRGMRVVYSAAPFDVGAMQAIVPYVTVLLLNAGEAAELKSHLGRAVSELGIMDVVVTRGAAGATHYHGGVAREYPTLTVTPVDTTGAGDTFAGYLAAGLDQGMAWADAMPFALAAAALSTTRPGTAKAIPTRDDVMMALRG